MNLSARQLQFPRAEVEWFQRWQEQITTLPLQRSKPIRTYLLALCAFDIVLFLSVVSGFSLFNPVIASSTTVPALQKVHIQDGTTTKDVLTELDDHGLSTTPLMWVQKRAISGTGVLVAARGDTLQIFEYPTAATAGTEARAIEERYAGKRSDPRWRELLHLYRRNNTLILYVGTRSEILTPLEAVLGTPHFGPGERIAIVGPGL